MNLEYPSNENLQIMLNELADRLKVANRELLNHEDYDLDKYDEIKFMYDMVVQKGFLSPSETQAFIDELRSVRKA